MPRGDTPEKAEPYDPEPLKKKYREELEEKWKQREKHYENNPEERRWIVEEGEITDPKTGEKRKAKAERIETIPEMGRRLGWSLEKQFRHLESEHRMIRHLSHESGRRRL